MTDQTTYEQDMSCLSAFGSSGKEWNASGPRGISSVFAESPNEKFMTVAEKIDPPRVEEN